MQRTTITLLMYCGNSGEVSAHRSNLPRLANFQNLNRGSCQTRSRSSRWKYLICNILLCPCSEYLQKDQDSGCHWTNILKTIKQVVTYIIHYITLLSNGMRCMAPETEQRCRDAATSQRTTDLEAKPQRMGDALVQKVFYHPTPNHLLQQTGILWQVFPPKMIDFCKSTDFE